MIKINHNSQCQAGDCFSIHVRILLSAAILIVAVWSPVLGQTAGFSSVYSETWIDGVANIEYDELEPTTPVFVAY
ncbi:MAG TPA: hypothetical protein VFH31_15060, partial [Pyrinomonadaceae bacterium]|nr:hypothetical protein [Pyrinomonadaceae bacterium]